MEICKAQKGSIMVRFSGKLDPYPAAEPNGFLLESSNAAFRSPKSSESPSAIEENHKPNDEGIANCVWVYPGIKSALCFSDSLSNKSKKHRSLFYQFTDGCSIIKLQVKLTLDHWRLLQNGSFLPTSPNRSVSRNSTCECISSTPGAISNCPFSIS